MLKIGIVDDHALFRKSLKLLINTFQDTEVVFETNGENLLAELQSTAADILLLDIQMPEMDGYQICRILRETRPDTRILIISQLTAKEGFHKIMEIGAHGYFTKNSDPEQLEAAIRDLHEKGYYFGVEFGSVIREAVIWERKNEQSFSGTGIVLTHREIEIIMLASKEYNSAEIAARLNITTRTVETHRKRIMEKTNSKNFIGVVLFALKNNLISLGDLT